MMADLLSLRALDRDEVDEISGNLNRLEEAVGHIPHRKALPLLGAIADIRATLEDTFSGGYAGRCEGCNSRMGHDDVGASVEDGQFCTLCADAYRAEAADGQ